MGGSEPLSSNWWDIRQTEVEEPSLNGLKLSNVYVHDTLEVILSYTNLDEILNLTQVCREWKDLTTRRSFWRQVYERNNLDWNSIPQHVKENPYSWMIFYAASRKGILTKNFVQNHSGENQFLHWTTHNRGGSPGSIVESPPVGIDPLPNDPDFDEFTECAFVTSFSWSQQQQKIDLWKIGLTPAVMRTLVPFEFVCSEMIGARFDCGVNFRLHVSLVDKQEQEILLEDLKVGTVEAGMNWLSESITLQVNPIQEQDLNDVRYLFVTNHGKDNQFWAGHYGAKFSRISVRLRCLHPSSQEEEKKSDFTRKLVSEQYWGHDTNRFY